jgi:hypothetical protein
VAWLGTRTVDCRRHPAPRDVWPVRVGKDAFGAGAPCRDLWLSPDHAVFVDGVLIPVRYLINGRTITQEAHVAVSYWHVELDRHDVLLAEGLPCESYLDTGNRGAFANASCPVQLHPEFALRVWQAHGCAKLVRDGAELEAARSHLLHRAAQLGHVRTRDPDLRLIVHGRHLRPMPQGRRLHFALPQAADRVRLVSRCAAPAETCDDSTDRRRLGVAVARLWLDEQDIARDATALRDGWHAPEAGWRWTDGDAELVVSGARRLAIELAMTGTYWRDSPAPADVGSLRSRRSGVAPRQFEHGVAHPHRAGDEIA